VLYGQTNQYVHIRADRRARPWDHIDATDRAKRVSVLGLAGAVKTHLLLKIAPCDGEAPQLQVQISAFCCYLVKIELPRLTLVFD
jgi:hypothetical protein